MLIIFDLDDTLIDTSGFITPFKLKCALQILLGKSPETMEIAEIFALNEQVKRTQEAIFAFARPKGISEAKIQQAIQELTAPLPSDFQVPCTPDAKEILEYYSTRYRIALVTGGHPPFQLEKLEKAGIEPSFFSKIAIPEDSAKKPFYKSIYTEFSIPPADVWVCGDRVWMDLAPAYELGLKTIHMQWGRGKKLGTETWVDYSIPRLSELRKIIA